MEIEKIKVELKKWETEFYKEHKHKPDKSDISKAPAEIQAAYRNYQQLKKKAEKEKEDNVWGDNLLKSKDENKPGNNKAASTQKAKKNTFTKSLAQKLMKTAMSSSPSQNVSSKLCNWDQDSAKKNETNPKVDSTLQQEKVFPSEPFNDDDDLSKIPGQSIFAKAASLTKSLKPSADSNYNKKVDISDKYLNIIKMSKNKSTSVPAGLVDGGMDELNSELKVQYKPSTSQNKIKINQEALQKLQGKNLYDNSSKGITKSVNKRISKESTPFSEATLFDGDVAENDSIDRPSSSGRKRKASEKLSIPHKRTKHISETTEPDLDEPVQDVIWNNEVVEYELDEDATGPGEETAPPMITQPKKPVRSKPLNNDNFVRLNMKVKGYRRKGQAMTGGQYKRQQWKMKMQQRDASRGTDKCFKCGGTGHWANKCKGNRGSSKSTGDIETDIPSTPVLDSTPFPTMKDAFMMASGVKKKPRQTKKALSVTKDEDVLNKEDSVMEEDEEEEDVEQYIVRSRVETKIITPNPMEPLFKPVDGKPPVTPKEVYNALKRFGYKDFRTGQEEAVMRILSGLSTLVVLSTGAGKSLCYQLPAFMYAQRSKCTTLVISPLVSLMEDQVSGLPPGVKGACLHANMNKVQREKVLERLSAGEVHFLLLSPEALVGGSSFGVKSIFSQLPPIAFACVDEAHCVSEWSHHFRPSYLRVCKVLKEKLGVQCILGLTATATLTTAASVAQHLGIDDYNSATIRGTPVPDNLHLSVSCDEDRDGALLELLQGQRFVECDSIIIYCTRREETVRLATMIRTSLKDKGPVKPKHAEKPVKKGKGKQKAPKSAWDAESYHAGLSPAVRKRVQNAFMSGRLRVVVATVAFGMGLDKSDVRAIIHYNMPKTFESYVQEIGRAGRDGLPAHCHVFLEPSGRDMQELKKHTHANTVDRYSIKKLLRKVFAPCKCRQAHDARLENNETENESVPTGSRICPGHERALPIDETVMALDMKEEGISTLLCYLELHEDQWVVNLQPVYSTCTLQCYGGPASMKQLANKFPPVAAAIARDVKLGISHDKSTKLEFPVVEISDMMGWDSGMVKRELYNLRWDLSVPGRPRKSNVLVEFSNKAFHLRAPGDLTDDEMDNVLGFLDGRIQTQERVELYQLQKLNDSLKSISFKKYYFCADEVDTTRSEKLKTILREYFERQPDLDQKKVTKLSFSREGSKDILLDEKLDCDNEDQVRCDIRSFINTYSHEHTLNGRAIARIFHGISSPCFPPETWGRVWRYWRCNISVDFNLLRKLATQELVKSR